MNGVGQTQAGNWIASLRGFLGTQAGPIEHCELCNIEIGHDHSHLIEPGTRRLLCACDGCALLFDNPESTHYRRVPRDARRLADFELSDAEWDAFLIPINMAFFYRSSTLGRIVALYPGPAGTTESTLDLDAWDDVAKRNPVLQEFAEDVEALLVNRVQDAREYYRVPIDRCYELVGVIRSHWSGMSGGDGPREAIQEFFRNLNAETAR